MKKLLYIAFLFFTAVNLGMAQTDPVWPDEPADRKQAEKEWVLLTDNVEAKKWVEAKKSFDWLHEKCPTLIKSLYQKGSKVYEGLVKAEADPVKKSELQDIALSLYDERIQHFGQEANVMNRKGLKAYNYLINRKTENQFLYDLYTKIYALNGDATYSSNLVALMKMNFKQFKAEKRTKDQVMDLYVEVSERFDTRIANDKKDSDIKLKSMVDKAFAKNIEINCDDIKNIIVPKFMANKEDVKIAKQIVGFMASAKCDKDQVYYDAVSLILEKEPSCGGGLAAAKRAKKDGDLDWSLKFFNKALELCGDENKGEIYYEMGSIYFLKKQRETARSYAQKSIAAGESHRARAHNLIGDIYFKSVKDCDPKEVVLFRSRYIAAFNEYKKGGSTNGMNKCKGQFPSNDELFTENKKVGDSQNTGCWMNVNVILQKR